MTTTTRAQRVIGVQSRNTDAIPYFDPGDRSFRSEERWSWAPRLGRISALSCSSRVAATTPYVPRS